jgi:hypothetical protein
MSFGMSLRATAFYMAEQGRDTSTPKFVDTSHLGPGSITTTWPSEAPLLGVISLAIGS